MRCRFNHDAEAVARFEMDKGCLCYPDDREQALCMQHVVKAEPLGSMKLTEVLDPGWALTLERYFGGGEDGNSE